MLITHKSIGIILNLFIATVWFINGLFCKVLNLVERHEHIVSQILGTPYSRVLTPIIGVLEILMAIWILSKIKPKLNAITQITVIVIMNILEFTITKDLLLWGAYNVVFALMFLLIIYYKNFIIDKTYAI